MSLKVLKHDGSITFSAFLEGKGTIFM